MKNENLNAEKKEKTQKFAKVKNKMVVYTETFQTMNDVVQFLSSVCECPQNVKISRMRDFFVVEVVTMVGVD